MYRKDSVWNDVLELKCLIVLKKLIEQNFKHGLRQVLCKELSKESVASPGTLSAKVGNYRSLAGLARHSNYSKNSKHLYDKYKDHSVAELEQAIKLIQGIP